MKTVNLWLGQLQLDACPGIDECVDVLGMLLPELQSLKETPQDPEWHAEGNVHIHTGMVLDECYQLLSNDAKHIQGQQRQALILSALLHDIAKPLATIKREINDIVRTVSPKHESKGRSYLAYRLMATDLPFDVINQVMALVGEHHQPKFLVIKNANATAYYRLARTVSMELVYWLEVADMSGRTCKDRAKQLAILEEFKMFSQEYGLWQVEDPYQSLSQPLMAQINELSPQAQQYVYHHAIHYYENGLITQVEETLGKTFEHRDDYANVVIMCGPSGSGKSSWIAKHLEQYDVVSLDDIRQQVGGDRASQKHNGKVMQLAKESLRESLRNKRNVVWDATCLRSDFRKIVADLARDYHALVTLVVFQMSESELISKDANRKFSVGSKVLQKQLQGAQWPELSEAHRFCIIDKNGEYLKKYGAYATAQWF